MKKLKDFLEVYKPKSPDEQKFVDKHVVIKHKDRNGNGDDVFNASNIKTVKRKEERHGYDVGEDEKVYEEVNLDDLLDEALDLLNSIDEKTLTSAEMKKREEVVKAIKKGNPKMDKSMAYAIATKTAKRVAEEAEELDELSKGKLATYINKAEDSADDLERKAIKGDDKSWRKMHKRLDSTLKAKHKWIHAKEEVEELDELSKDLLRKTGGRMLRKGLGDGPRAEKHMKSANLASAKLYPDQYKNSPLKAKVNATNEEVEELDEISASKLTDYTSKASDARGHRGMSAAKLDKRYGGVALAHEKIRARHAKVPATEGYVPTADEPTDADKKTAQKVRDLLAKEKKPVKEETQIDELSKDTLGSYVKKASERASTQNLIAGMKAAKDENSSANLKQAQKRLRGVGKAIDRLTKEDIINRAIDKYVPEEIKYTPTERFLQRLEGLSEAHIDTLLGLFEALNKDNQTQMIDMVETREGVNQLLNFALENRGE